MQKDVNTRQKVYKMEIRFYYYTMEMLKGRNGIHRDNNNTRKIPRRGSIV